MTATEISDRIKELTHRLEELPAIIEKAESDYARALASGSGEDQLNTLERLERERRGKERAIEVLKSDKQAAEVHQLEANRDAQITQLQAQFRPILAAQETLLKAIEVYNAEVASLRGISAGSHGAEILLQARKPADVQAVLDQAITDVQTNTRNRIAQALRGPYVAI